MFVSGRRVITIGLGLVALFALSVGEVSARPAPGPQAQTAAKLDYGIVYVRVPRSTVPIQITKDDGFKYQKKVTDPETGETTKVTTPVVGTLDPSFQDTLPEVHYIRGGFNAPGQLVWLKKDGAQKIIYDCTGANTAQEPAPMQGQDTCVPMDPAVSYDGTKVAFAVYHGSYGNTRNMRAYPPRNGEVGKLFARGDKPSWAGIYIYNFKTNELTHWTHQDHVWDMSPVWLPNGKIMFTSTRGNANGPVWQRYVHSKAHYAQQLWIANADGSHARNVDPHDQINVLHPFVHSSGRVFFSSHQINVVRTERTNQTTNNLWWLESVDSRGGDLNAHMHAHRFKLGYVSKKLGNVLLTALHFLTERSNGDLCTDSYYRRNNFGAGAIYCWPALADGQNPDGDGRTPLGHEGAYPFNLPKGFYFGIPGDAGDAGHHLPHVRDPAGIPDNQLMFAAGLGPHNTCHWAKVHTLVNDYSASGQSCDFGIYRSASLPLSAPRDSDALLVIDSPDWDEFMPKPVLPYARIYGMDKPVESNLSNSKDGSSIFASATAFVGNVLTSGGWHGPKDPSWCAFQGCALQAVPLTKIKFMRFWKAITNTRQYTNNNRMQDVWGQKLELLGDVPVQSDGSFAAKLPPDTPFLMSGVDADGNSIARHQNLMSLRPGEKQVCSGCHLHDPTDAENAERPFSQTEAGKLLANGQAAVPRIPPGQGGVLEFKTDIYPMLKQNCGSCHGGSKGSNKPILTASVGTVYKTLLNNLIPLRPETDDHSDGDKKKAKVYAHAPWMTRYVNVFFARESLLYWKALGHRADGRTDGDLSDDFDFGPAHAPYLSSQQLKILADWIEAGGYYNQFGDADTPPDPDPNPNPPPDPDPTPTPPPGGGDEPAQLQNNIGVDGVSGAAGEDHDYYIEVPAGAHNLVMSISGGSGNADLYTASGRLPTTRNFQCRSWKGGNSDSCTVASPVSGRYYIKVHGYSAYSGVTVKASYSTSDGNPAPKKLQNNVGVEGVSGAVSEDHDYYIEVPVGAHNLVMSISGGSGNADLYAAHERVPTTRNFQCRSWKGGNSDSCTVASPVSGKYYIKVHGYSAYSGVTVKASYSMSEIHPAPKKLQNNVGLGGVSGAAGEDHDYYIEVPAGAHNLVMSISGGSGNADLYAAHERVPTIRNFQCRSWKGGNSDSCTVVSPVSGKYYIRVHGYSAYFGVTVKASYSVGGGSTDPEQLQNGVPVTDISGAHHSEKYYAVTAPPGSLVTISTSGGTGNVNLYVSYDRNPTTRNFNCGPNRTGNNETCSKRGRTGKFRILLYGSGKYSGVELKASW